jgi:DNA polymerase III subunit beta
MNITVERTILQDRLELLGKVSTKHVTLPVLQCVLISVADTRATRTATNLEIGIETTISVKMEKEGVVAVPAQTLLQTIQFLQQKEVTLHLEGTVLIVEGGSSKTEIKTIPVDEFPTIPKITGTSQTIQGELFAQGIRTAAFAASQSSIKPELGSIFVVQKKEQTLTFVATDSFRLMEKTVSQKNVILQDSILIPYKNALELARVCEAREQNPDFYVNENQCALSFPDGVYITSRLTSGSFPDYVQIIPKEFSTHTTMLKQDFLQALKKTNIFLNKFMQVGVQVDATTCTITAQSGEVGTTTEIIPAQTDGDALQLNFNQRYIIEPLQFIQDESLIFHFAGIGRPLVIEGVHDTTLRYLVMPMNK